MVGEKAGAAATQVPSELGFDSIQAVWTMLYRCGQRRCALGGDRVTGEVAADELFPGGPESGAPGKVRFAGSVELDGVGLDQVRFGIVPNGSAGSLSAFPHANVGP